ncbi:MAG: DUF1707 SHOCT-like domain-containing protein [Solirubrobacteraceae bacterium]
MHERGSDYGEGFGPSVRAGDADREATVERLRKHHAEGRIDVTEFQERLDRVYDSKTLGELRQLFNDLPDDAARERSVGWSSGAPRRWIFPLVPVVFALFVLSALIPGFHHHPGPGPGPWILIPLFFLFRFVFWRRRPWGRGWAGRRRRQSEATDW